MKPTHVFLVVVGLVVGAGVASVAWERTKYGEILHTRAQFEQLKPGDRIVYVCRECDAKRTVALTGVAEAMEYCRVGAKLSCPGCKDEMRVLLKETSGASGPTVEVRYVNEKGHECLTIARALPES